MGTKKSQKTDIKKNIDETIDVLEATIRQKRKSANKQHTSPIPMYDDKDYQFRQRMVWATVVFIGIGIFGMWGWHMKTVFYDAARGAIGKSNPLDTAGEHFDEAMLMAGAGTEQKEDTLTDKKTSSTLSQMPVEDIQKSAEDEEETSTSTLDKLISTLQAGIQTSTTPPSDISPQ